MEVFPDGPWSLDMMDLSRNAIHRSHKGDVVPQIRAKMEQRLGKLLVRLPIYTNDDKSDTEHDKLKNAITKDRNPFLTNPEVPPTTMIVKSLKSQRLFPH